MTSRTHCFAASSSLKLLMLLLPAGAVALAQIPAAPTLPAKPGIKDVQVPFAALKPSATFQIGGTADWVLVTDDSVWVAASKPYSVQRIDPAASKVVASVSLPGEACSGLVAAFGSLWVPLCGKTPSLARIDLKSSSIIATLPVGPAGPEGGIAASGDSIWIVTESSGTLTRIDPQINGVRQKISIPPGSFNPIFSNGMVWITGFDKNLLTAVDATTGKVVMSIPVGPKPRFLTSGAGSVWTLNQGDGTVSRVNASSKKLVATIALGTPGPGGDICYAGNSVWTSMIDLPLTRIDAKTNKVRRQWIGQGGDSLRAGHASVWLTDYHRGLLWRIPREQVVP